MVIFLIERYEIVKDGNEEILIIYLNYKYEFSKDFINFENDNNLKEKIKKIKFNGSKVIIMVGTLVLGTLFINASFSTIINNNEISNKNIVKEETSISTENKDLEDNVKEEINNNQDTTKSKKDEDTNDKIDFKQNIISDIYNKVNEEENDKTEEKQVKEIMDCPKCGGKIIEKKTKRGKIFYGCNNYPKCKYASWDKPTGNLCKECGEPLVEKNGSETCPNCNKQ